MMVFFFCEIFDYCYLIYDCRREFFFDDLNVSFLEKDIRDLGYVGFRFNI